jgi:hypothetical protein
VAAEAVVALAVAAASAEWGGADWDAMTPPLRRWEAKIAAAAAASRSKTVLATPDRRRVGGARDFDDSAEAGTMAKCLEMEPHEGNKGVGYTNDAESGSGLRSYGEQYLKAHHGMRRRKALDIRGWMTLQE